MKKTKEIRSASFIGLLFGLVGIFFIIQYFIVLIKDSISVMDYLTVASLGFVVMMLSSLSVIKIESCEATKDNLEINKKLLTATINTNSLLKQLVYNSEVVVIGNETGKKENVENKDIKKEKSVEIDVEIDCLVNDINKLKKERIKISTDVNRMAITNQINELTIKKNALKINEISKKDAIQNELDILKNNKNNLDLQLKLSEKKLEEEIATLETKLEILNIKKQKS